MKTTGDELLAWEQAVLSGAGSDAPTELLADMRLLQVEYVNLEGTDCVGQLVVANDLASEVLEIFSYAKALKYPIHRMQPIAHPRFWKDGSISDDLSMQANNTSAFCYRRIAGSNRLSQHAFGRAIDINPLWNPCVYTDGRVVPEGDEILASHPGKLSADHPLVVKFLSLGWIWGGNWQDPKDNHHFEKPLGEHLSA